MTTINGIRPSAATGTDTTGSSTAPAGDPSLGPDGLPVGKHVPVPAPAPGSSPAGARISGLLGQMLIPGILGVFVVKSVVGDLLRANGGTAPKPRIPYFEHLVPKSTIGATAVAFAAGASGAWAINHAMPDDWPVSRTQARHGAAIAAGAIGALGGVAALRAKQIGQVALVEPGLRVLAGGAAIAAGMELVGTLTD